MNGESIRKLSSQELFNYFFPRTKKILRQYKYLELNEKDYLEIILMTVQMILKGNEDKDLDIIFDKIIILTIKDYVNKVFENDEERCLKIITNYINHYLKMVNSSNLALKELKKLESLFENFDYMPTPNVLITLLRNNEIINNLVSLIVKNNIVEIKKGKADFIFQSTIVILLIETYCMINKIEIKKEDLTSDKYFYENSDDDNKNIDFSCSATPIMAFLNENKLPVLTSEEEKELFERVMQGDEEARKIIIERNLRLVISVAKRYANSSIQLDFWDIVQEGNIGLVKAIERFDISKGYKFSTYATWWIKQSITRAIADTGRTIRLPVHVVEEQNKLKRIYNRYSVEKGREPTKEELVMEMERTKERISEIMHVSSQTMVSLNTPLKENEDTTLENFIPSEEMSIEEQFEHEEEKEFLKKLMQKYLTIKQQQVINLRFGIDGNRIHTLEEVGREMHITRERVRQIESSALRVLRIKGKVRGINAYSERPDKASENLLMLSGRKNIQIEEKKETIKEKDREVMLKSIYEIWKDYDRSDIDYVISKLDSEERYLILLRNRDNPDNPIFNQHWDDKDEWNFYKKIVPKITRLLLQLKSENLGYINRRNDILNNSKKSSDELLQDEQVLKLIHDITSSDKLFLDTLSLKEISLIAFKIYSFNTNHSSIKDISSLLGVPEDVIRETIKGFLEYYRSNIIDLTEKEKKYYSLKKILESDK